MIRKRVILLSMLGVGALALGTSFGQPSHTSQLATQKGWHNNLTNATAQARKTGKPLMVVLRCDP